MNGWTAVDSLNEKRKILIEDILKRFFSKYEVKQFSENFLAQKYKLKLSGIKSLDKEQIEYDIKQNSKINAQIDLLITYAETRLPKEKFLELLLLLGQYSITYGEFFTAIDIHEKIVKETKGLEEFTNFTASAILALGEIYSRQALWDLSFKYIKQAYDMYEKTNDPKGCASCENLLGTIYGDFGDLKSARDHFEKSLGWLENVPDTYQKGKLEINLGIINNMLGDYEAALSYYRRSLVNFEKLRDLKRIVEIRHNIGMLYTKKRQLSLAIKEFDRCISIAMQTGYLSSVGLAYLSKAYIYTEQKDFYVAEAFADKALDICRKINDKLSVADLYKIKGVIFKHQKKYTMAEDYLLTSLRLNKELKNQLNESETAVELGKLYKELNRTEDSARYFKIALKYYKKINSSVETERVKEIIQV